MKKKYILIAGCAGFIGSNFVRYLLSKKNKYSILGVDNLTYSSNPESIKEFKKNKSFTFLKKDISNLESLKKFFSKINIFHIINFAAETHVDNSIIKPDIFIKTNIVGTFNLLKLCTDKWIYDQKKKNNYKRSKFLQVSTDEVYGSIERGSFSENSKFKPNSPYSASKASADLLVRAFHKTHKLNTLITNSSNNFGPYQHQEKFVPKIIHCLKSKKKIPIYGKGSNIRNWLFVNENTEGIYSVFNRGKFGRNYNIGSTIELTNYDLTLKICDLYKKITNSQYNYRSLISFVPDRKGHDLRYSLSIKKIYKELGWKPKNNFDNQLIETILHYLR